MKANKIVKNILKNGIHIIAIISILIVIIQLKQIKNKFNIQEAKQETTQKEEVAENFESRNSEESQITSRHLVSKRNQSLEKEILSKEEIKEEQYTKIEDVTISKDMDLTTKTGLSKEDFKVLISKVKYDTSKFFYDNSDLIYDLCEEYQINEIFFCGLISAESGWNIASNHRRTYNYISLMTKNGLIQFSSTEDGLRAAAKALHNNYLTEGGCFYNGKTLYGVKTKFCPASSTWVGLVYGRMEQIINCR